VAGELPLGPARAMAGRWLLRDTCTLIRPRTVDDLAGGSYPDPDGPERIGPLACSFRAVSGDEATRERIAERGSYRVYLPVELRHPDTQEPLDVASIDAIEVLGTAYQVVWTPPAPATALLRTIGLKE
jgi:hypothetical protein